MVDGLVKKRHSTEHAIHVRHTRRVPRSDRLVEAQSQPSPKAFRHPNPRRLDFVVGEGHIRDEGRVPACDWNVGIQARRTTLRVFVVARTDLIPKARNVCAYHRSEVVGIGCCCCCPPVPTRRNTIANDDSRIGKHFLFLFACVSFAAGHLSGRCNHCAVEKEAKDGRGIAASKVCSCFGHSCCCIPCLVAAVAVSVARHAMCQESIVRKTTRIGSSVCCDTRHHLSTPFSGRVFVGSRPCRKYCKL